MVRRSLLCLLLSALASAPVATAQPPQPRGPAPLDTPAEPGVPREFDLPGQFDVTGQVDRSGQFDGSGEFRLVDEAAITGPSARRAAADAAAQARRQRAAFHAHQRALRSEANAWLGISPLRPSWPSAPSMHSYYQPRRIIYVPVGVH